MNYWPYIYTFLCVIGLSLGQILFKFSAKYFNESHTVYAVKPLVYLLAAFALYGFVSIAWVYILQKIDLGKVYPVMALAFIIVPIGSQLFFGEKFTIQYLIGVLLIVIGIIVSISAR